MIQELVVNLIVGITMIADASTLVSNVHIMSHTLIIHSSSKVDIGIETECILHSTTVFLQEKVYSTYIEDLKPSQISHIGYRAY